MEGNAAVQTFPQPDGAPLVDARGLHGFLGITTPFHKWVSRRTEDYGFENGEDFWTEKSETGGRPRIDYHLTLDMAKELAMVERTEIGRDTAERLMKLSRLADSPNENEATVAKEMLDKIGKKFGMTGEEARFARA